MNDTCMSSGLLHEQWPTASCKRLLPTFALQGSCRSMALNARTVIVVDVLLASYLFPGNTMGRLLKAH